MRERCDYCYACMFETGEINQAYDDHIHCDKDHDEEGCIQGVYVI